MSPRKAKTKEGAGSRSGSRKKGVRQPKAARVDGPTPDADGIKVTPFEESNGFQIFRVAKTDVNKTGATPPQSLIDAPRDDAPSDSGMPAAPTAAGNGASSSDSVGQWMAETIDSIVREEVRLAVTRITRSVIRETRTGGSSKS